MSFACRTLQVKGMCHCLRLPSWPDRTLCDLILSDALCLAQFLVKRKGCPLLDYGLVDMAAAKRQRQGVLEEAEPASVEKCPLPLSLVDDYEVRQPVSGSISATS